MGAALNTFHALTLSNLAVATAKAATTELTNGGDRACKTGSAPTTGAWADPSPSAGTEDACKTACA